MVIAQVSIIFISIEMGEAMKTPYAELAGMLGISGPGGSPLGPLQLVARIRQGLPLATLYSVSGQIAPGDKHFVTRIVSRASLSRHKASAKPLTPDESNRLARVAAVWSSANSVWRDPDLAREFLFRPHMMLEGRRPIDCIVESELGAELVKDILGRLVHGTAA